MNDILYATVLLWPIFSVTVRVSTLSPNLKKKRYIQMFVFNFLKRGFQSAVSTFNFLGVVAYNCDQ